MLHARSMTVMDEKKGAIMCGIAGFLHSAVTRAVVHDKALLQQMTDRLSHRGPDDAGYWHDAGPPTSFNRGSIPERAPADAVGQRPLRHYLQW